ncbi:transketolase-like TK C-terminal-containing protein [Lichenicoccus roseus]|uniref:Uncharacterized protein n=1 Tax=Lichenicoccus roseus TaxID=2683649 RepID=A0A5R9J646_9PROT|nr:hypothetical protein [Lichenicoccus roseus]TLU71977.1 hypothetical protein FE263_12620 [Lichenicoccus roseus]
MRTVTDPPGRPRSLAATDAEFPGAGGIEELGIDTTRTLSMDAVQDARSGHSCTPMSLAPVAQTPWQNVLSYDPAEPRWPGRDRSVLPAGHASMLLNSLISLCGLEEIRDEGQDGQPTAKGAPAPTLDDLHKPRQAGSETPGHPGYRSTSIVETTTGRLGLLTIRDGDGDEVAGAWRVVVPLKEQPVALILSRQPMPTMDRGRHAAVSGPARSSYLLADGNGTPDVILIATGTEPGLAMGTIETLRGEDIKARVVPLPCRELFQQQEQSYREAGLRPEATGRVVIEQAAAPVWERHAGTTCSLILMRTFGRRHRFPGCSSPDLRPGRSSRQRASRRTDPKRPEGRSTTRANHKELP